MCQENICGRVLQCECKPIRGVVWVLQHLKAVVSYWATGLSAWVAACLTFIDRSLISGCSSIAALLLYCGGVDSDAFRKLSCSHPVLSIPWRLQAAPSLCKTEHQVILVDAMGRVFKT